MLFFLLINVEMPTIVGILTFMSRKHFMLSWLEHGKSFITLGPDLVFSQVVLSPIFYIVFKSLLLSVCLLLLSPVKSHYLGQKTVRHVHPFLESSKKFVMLSNSFSALSAKILIGYVISITSCRISSHRFAVFFSNSIVDIDLSQA